MNASEINSRGGTNKWIKVFKVPIFDIDALKTEYNIKFNCLIMDIEGGEFDFVDDFAENLPEFNTVILEQHPHILGETKADAVRNAFRNAGMVCIDTSSHCEVWRKPL